MTDPLWPADYSWSRRRFAHFRDNLHFHGWRAAVRYEPGYQWDNVRAWLIRRAAAGDLVLINARAWFPNHPLDQDHFHAREGKRVIILDNSLDFSRDGEWFRRWTAKPPDSDR